MCVCVSVHVHVCRHLSVCVCVDICLYACVWTSVCVYMQLYVCVVCLCVCMDICVYVLVCVSVSVWTCTCVCVSLLFCNVNVYHFQSYHCCSIWHGYTVHNDMESMFFFNFIQACKCCNIKHFLCQFKKLVIILLVIFYNRLVLLYTVIYVIYSL